MLRARKISGGCNKGCSKSAARIIASRDLLDLESDHHGTGRSAQEGHFIRHGDSRHIVTKKKVIEISKQWVIENIRLANVLFQFEFTHPRVTVGTARGFVSIIGRTRVCRGESLTL